MTSLSTPDLPVLDGGPGFDGPVFDDGKAPDALRTIGEVAKALGIRQHVLRYWEEQFPMLQPIKRSGNRRYYRPEHIAMIVRIDRLVNHEGYTLKGATKALAAPFPESAPGASVPVAPVVAEPVVAAPTAEPGLTSLLPALRKLRAGLARALVEA